MGLKGVPIGGDTEVEYISAESGDEMMCFDSESLS